ncbi:LysR substrate-binding domain-containing protein, partial [Kingella oralis]
MKLQQLRYAVEVFRHNLNVSEAAEALFTSQPGVSKQIRLLEDELGVQIFIRSGKRIVAVTQVGMAVLETAEQVLRGVRNIKNIGGEFAKTESGSFTLGATHDLLRFRLPSVLAGFRALFPDVRLVLKQGSPAELMGMVFNGEVDLALTMDVAGDGEDLRKLSFGEWRYVLVLPRGHELADKEEISLADVAALPLLTYGFAFDGGALAARAFARARLSWHTVFESDDGGVLLDYVRLG